MTLGLALLCTCLDMQPIGRVFHSGYFRDHKMFSDFCYTKSNKLSSYPSLFSYIGMTSLLALSELVLEK